MPKKVIKKSNKQNVKQNVKQSVNIVIGDIKKKSSGKKRSVKKEVSRVQYIAPLPIYNPTPSYNPTTYYPSRSQPVVEEKAILPASEGTVSGIPVENVAIDNRFRSERPRSLLEEEVRPIPLLPREEPLIEEIPVRGGQPRRKRRSMLENISNIVDLGLNIYETVRPEPQIREVTTVRRVRRPLTRDIQTLGEIENMPAESNRSNLLGNIIEEPIREEPIIEEIPIESKTPNRKIREVIPNIEGSAIAGGDEVILREETPKKGKGGAPSYFSIFNNNIEDYRRDLDEDEFNELNSYFGKKLSDKQSERRKDLLMKVRNREVLNSVSKIITTKSKKK